MQIAKIYNTREIPDFVHEFFAESLFNEGGFTDYIVGENAKWYNEFEDARLVDDWFVANGAAIGDQVCIRQQ